MTDPIADMLTRIRNANTARRDVVEVPASKIKAEIARVLKEEGYIRDYELSGQGPENRPSVLRIYLKYAPGKKKVITGLKRISKPGLRVYAGKDELPRVLGGLGIAIISTSRGLMTDAQARKLGLGGEVICFVW